MIAAPRRSTTTAKVSTTMQPLPQEIPRSRHGPGMPIDSAPKILDPASLGAVFLERAGATLVAVGPGLQPPGYERSTSW